MSLAATLQIHERMLAVMGGAAVTAGMISVLQLGGYRLAYKHRDSLKSEKVVPDASLALTPWVTVPLRPPSLLTGSLVASVLAKAAAWPHVKPISAVLLPNLLGEQRLFQIGAALFVFSAYQHYLTIKYLVKIGTPVISGYDVKTLCIHGPFEFFKHPMYCAMMGISVSAALLNDSLWCLVPSAVLGAFLWGVVIPREERYMVDKFGQAYSNKQYGIFVWLRRITGND
mmetsp:Transcript_40839/g.102172  ORF Transcript_40839/g.102172 Transcript_40839/m.102172 type:complete len:228 (-) Transcript_40839:91-774(-)|eukprot:CAMPEP_0173439876 /NCGR_PEP_ID=MMETSP1357-20121228/21787_1 /TAXON_ID=77926 /ORGANISM="Hemiselmis rufescens, Strain PCC563" /LENGTH=227 /DNA_ID=CAMNT_0014405287 /DNA_START=89 /DNA_END=772 /DNA_ORIENTATION=-